MGQSLTFASMHRLGALLQKGELSPVELTLHFLERIEQCDGRLNAFMLVTRERALAAARAAEAAIAGGHYLGPLHGIPVALKDLIDVAGLPTTAGSLIYRDRVAEDNAPVARKLMEAGAVLLGKTHMVEFAYGGWASTTTTAPRGTPGTGGCIAFRAARAAARAWPWPRAWQPQHWAATPAAPCASRPRSAAWWDSSRPSAGSATRGWCPIRTNLIIEAQAPPLHAKEHVPVQGMREAAQGLDLHGGAPMGGVACRVR